MLPAGVDLHKRFCTSSFSFKDAAKRTRVHGAFIVLIVDCSAEWRESSSKKESTGRTQNV